MTFEKFGKTWVESKGVRPTYPEDTRFDWLTRGELTGMREYAEMSGTTLNDPRSWAHRGSDNDIVAYRVIAPPLPEIDPRFAAAHYGHDLKVGDSHQAPTFHPLPVIDAMTDQDGWIEWRGGPQPLPSGTRVEYIMRDGTSSEGDEDVRHLDWDHEGLSDWDVVQYRIIKQAEIPPVVETAPAARPVKQMMLSADPAERKGLPICSGVLDYFPLAVAEVARVSKAGNDQHNPGQPLHWDRTKSLDHADCIPRHLIDRGSFDTDGMRHSAKLAWRALALLQTELELEKAAA